jgi:MoxR-like ATPase
MIEDQNFYDALVTKFPDVVTTQQVSRSQIADTMESLNTTKWPIWLMTNKVGRGLYSIAGGNAVPKDEGSGYAVEQVVSNTTYDYVPAKDENYVPFGNFRDIETIVKSKIFYPTYVAGPTGNGKSTTIEQACAKFKRSMIRVNLNMMTDEDQLIGSKTLEDGTVKIVDGPIIIAMKMGIPILLDEVDAGAANTLLCLQPILEGKPYYYKLRNEVVYPAPGFNIFATANTKGKGSEDGRYIGTNILNEAFLERFAVTFNQDYPNAATERKIVLNLMKSFACEDEDFADTLVKWADAIRRTFADGGVDETITTRRLVHIVKAFSIFKDKKKAVELCTNRFDEITRTAFLDLFEKVSTPEAAPAQPVEEKDVEIPF